MKRIFCLLVAALAVSNLSFADEAAFNLRLADAKGKQAEARLTFNDDNKNLAVHVADRDLVTVPYDQLDKFSYEYTKEHRVTAGAITMVASLGAGAIVMLTESKSHWPHIDYHEEHSQERRPADGQKRLQENLRSRQDTYGQRPRNARRCERQVQKGPEDRR